MAFCPDCGKEIQDGEVCLCKQSANEAQATAQAEQTTQTAQTVAPNLNVDVKEIANGFFGLVKQIIADPKEGTKKFVKGISWLNIGIVAAIYAILDVLFGIWSKIEANIERRKNVKEFAEKMGISFKKYVDEFDVDTSVYGFGDILKGAIMDVLQVAAGIAISAVVFYFAVKLIKKAKITWKMAFAIAVIELLAIVPCTLVYEILGLIPSFKLLSWIMSAVLAVRSFGSTILTYLGLESVCEDTKSTVYVAVPAWAICSIASSLVAFLLNSLLS